MIKIENVSFGYTGAEVLHDLSCELPRGGLTAIIGPNGAGKSTLLHLIARISPFQAGRISIEGRDIQATPPNELARIAAFVAQEPGVISRLRVADLVAFGRWPWSRSRLTQQDHQIVKEALSSASLTDLADRFLDELSGGQRQLAHIAMAFAQNTEWLLLDEPLNHLDMSRAQALMSRLHALSRPGPSQKSVALVIHDINHAAAWADHVIAIKDGQAAFEGPPETALTRQKLQDLFGINVEPIRHAGRIVVPHHR